jgi:hypothetical protein
MPKRGTKQNTSEQHTKKVKKDTTKDTKKISKYVPIKTINTEGNTVFVRTFEEIASIYEEEDDKRYFYYRKLAKQFSESDRDVESAWDACEEGFGSIKFEGKINGLIREIIATGTLSKITDYKNPIQEQEKEVLSETKIKAMGKEIRKLAEYFIGDCLNWTGGDDSIGLKEELKYIKGQSFTSYEGEETLVLQRVDKKPFNEELRKALMPYFNEGANDIIKAANEWTKMTSYKERPITQEFVDNIKLIMNPLIPSGYTDDVDYPTRWVDDDYAVVGALGYYVEYPGNLLERRWYWKTIKESKNKKNTRMKEYQDDIKYFKKEGKEWKGKKSKKILKLLPV